ncbi:hypothetical protein [Sphingobium sp. Sx8-8]|uniref:hypothetical protein n=1 Tax=Sphingobium sp. Sx8-8 TaxID=2933617 RepID=UPI001F5621DB|nr:hypothetical protein [Sphingobium sp. Sx8-8]
MTAIRLEEIPDAGGGRWPHVAGHFRSMRMGDMEVGLTQVPPLDCTDAYSDGMLPGGICPCPHYGYVFKGRIRCRFPGTDWPDEVAETGMVYFFPAGHVLIYEEETVALEINPAHALGMRMDAMERAATARPDRHTLNQQAAPAYEAPGG